jgi:hypothetical protein
VQTVDAIVKTVVCVSVERSSSFGGAAVGAKSVRHRRRVAEAES